MKNLLLFVFLSTQLCLAQQTVNINKENATLTVGTESVPFIRATSKSQPAVEGTVYLNEEWTQASVTSLANKKIIKLLARFNTSTGEVEILKEKDFVSLDPVSGISVELSGKKFVPIKIEPSSKAIFAESLVNGSFSLFRVYHTKIIKAATDASLLNIDNKDRVVIQTKFYFKDSSGTIQELPKKNKKVLALFDKGTQDFIKNEQLNLKKDADIIHAFIFYNQSNTPNQ